VYATLSHATIHDVIHDVIHGFIHDVIHERRHASLLLSKGVDPVNAT
jgi:hypothetical protein